MKRKCGDLSCGFWHTLHGTLPFRLPGEKNNGRLLVRTATLKINCIAPFLWKKGCMSGFSVFLVRVCTWLIPFFYFVNISGTFLRYSFIYTSQGSSVQLNYYFMRAFSQAIDTTQWYACDGLEVKLEGMLEISFNYSFVCSFIPEIYIPFHQHIKI